MSGAIGLRRAEFWLGIATVVGAIAAFIYPTYESTVAANQAVRDQVVEVRDGIRSEHELFKENLQKQNDIITQKLDHDNTN